MIGIADQFRDAVVEGGKSKEEATAQVWWVLNNSTPLRNVALNT